MVVGLHAELGHPGNSKGIVLSLALWRCDDRSVGKSGLIESDSQNVPDRHPVSRAPIHSTTVIVQIRFVLI
jgi:hypothetical protein